jgi:hypothetical protein
MSLNCKSQDATYLQTGKHYYIEKVFRCLFLYSQKKVETMSKTPNRAVSTNTFQ